ncbi:MAG: hypothetical protein ACREJO_09610 [Phycisphaerales bacterium]
MDSEPGNIPPPIPPVPSLPPPPLLGAHQIHAGPVDFDLACLSCGYSLRGLDRLSSCPECGSAVARSLMGDLLRFSSPQYVATLKLGALIIIIATLGEVVAGVAGIGLAIAFPTAGQLGSQMLSVAASLALLTGWWLLATTDPAQEGRDESITARRILRIALAVQVFCTIGSFALQLSSPSMRLAMTPAGTGGPGSPFAGLMSNPIWLLTIGLALINFAAIVTAYITSMMYIRGLCRRFPNPELERFAGVMIWLGPVLSTVGIAVCVGPLAGLICRVIILIRVHRNLWLVQQDMAMPIRLDLHIPANPPSSQL